IAAMGLAPPEIVPPDEIPPTIAGQETGAFTLSLANLAGTSVGTDATIKVYLTSPDVYTDVYEAYDAIDRQGRLVDPYDPNINAGSKRSTPTDGDVSFTVTSKEYNAGSDVNTGSDFGIVIIDDGVLIGDYNPEVGKVKINARLNDELTVIATVVEGVAGFMGSEVELAPRGNISFYDTLSGDDNMASYELDTSDNETIEDQDFDLNVRLNGDDTELRDISVYVEVRDDLTDTADLNLDDVEIKVDGVKIDGTTLSEVSDLASNDPLRKNAPAVSSSTLSTLYVVEGGQFDLTRINSDNYVAVVITLVDYDADMDAATTTDEGKFVITLVASNGHKDSEMAGDDFIFGIDENGTSGYTAE
ncbi:MAG: hypothetical protein KAS66_09620, partial [Candidatus Omnitrophica bacterium]|nr:hypothetical protein [Candidatus Omnitrophota bacterium]